MMRKKPAHEFDYYVLLFFALAFVGWLWEVGLFLCTEHAFINRGVYRGPYLPIYGVGGLALCFLLRSFRGKPVRVFLLSMLLCSGLEYFTSWFLERLWQTKWWDYSGHFCNLNGRICLLGAVVFGLGGTALICLLLPLYERAYQKLPKRGRAVLCLILLAVFIADITYCAVRPNTGRGISFSRQYGQPAGNPRFLQSRMLPDKVWQEHGACRWRYDVRSEESPYLEGAGET